MALIERTKNVLMVIVGQSNETKDQPSVARPILETTALTSPARTKYTIGAGHTFTLNSAVRFAKEGTATTNDKTLYAFDTDSITVLDADVNPSTYGVDGAFVYDNEGSQHSVIGCPNNGTGMWTHLTEELWENKKEWVQVVDTFAVGGSSFITDWCGFTGSGDSGSVLSSTDGGFDPNDYLSDIVADLATWSNSFDECVVIIQHGQADANRPSSTYTSTGATTSSKQSEYYTTALTNIVNYVKAQLNPTTIYMGSSQVGGVGASTQDATGFAEVIVPSMRSVIASESLIEGAMLSEALGTGSQHNFTDAHLNTLGQIQAGRVWAELIALPESTSTPTGNSGSGVTTEYTNSTNLPTGRDFGTKRYQDDGDIIPNYIHTDFPDR